MEYFSGEQKNASAEEINQQNYFSYLNLKKSGLPADLQEEEIVIVRRTRRVLYKNILEKSGVENFDKGETEKDKTTTVREKSKGGRRKKVPKKKNLHHNNTENDLNIPENTMSDKFQPAGSANKITVNPIPEKNCSVKSVKKLRFHQSGKNRSVVDSLKRPFVGSFHQSVADQYLEDKKIPYKKRKLLNYFQTHIETETEKNRNEDRIQNEKINKVDEGSDNLRKDKVDVLKHSSVSPASDPPKIDKMQVVEIEDEENVTEAGNFNKNEKHLVVEDCLQENICIEEKILGDDRRPTETNVSSNLLEKISEPTSHESFSRRDSQKIVEEKEKDALNASSSILKDTEKLAEHNECGDISFGSLEICECEGQIVAYECEIGEENVEEEPESKHFSSIMDSLALTDSDSHTMNTAEIVSDSPVRCDQEKQDSVKISNSTECNSKKKESKIPTVIRKLNEENTVTKNEKENVELCVVEHPYSRGHSNTLEDPYDHIWDVAEITIGESNEQNDEETDVLKTLVNTNENIEKVEDIPGELPLEVTEADKCLAEPDRSKDRLRVKSEDQLKVKVEHLSLQNNNEEISDETDPNENKEKMCEHNEETTLNDGNISVPQMNDKKHQIAEEIIKIIKYSLENEEKSNDSLETTEQDFLSTIFSTETSPNKSGGRKQLVEYYKNKRTKRFMETSLEMLRIIKQMRDVSLRKSALSRLIQEELSSKAEFSPPEIPSTNTKSGVSKEVQTDDTPEYPSRSIRKEKSLGKLPGRSVLKKVGRRVLRRSKRKEELSEPQVDDPKLVRMERTPDRRKRKRQESRKLDFCGSSATQDLSEFVLKDGESQEDSDLKAKDSEIKDVVASKSETGRVEVIHYKPSDRNTFANGQRKYCTFCNVGYTSDVAMEKHVERCRSKPSNVQRNPISIFYCKICNFGITDEAYFKQHQEKCHIDYVCNRGDASNPSVETGSKVKKNRSLGRYKCPKCEYASNNVGHMKTHKRIHDKIPLCVCEVCRKGFSRLDALKIHMFRHIDVAQEVEELDRTDVQNGNAFKSTLKVKINNKKFTVLKYACSQCDYATPIPDCMDKHFSGVHLNVSGFRCNLCNFTSKLKSNLKQHLNWHLRERTFKCSYCPYETINKSYIKKHENQVHLRNVSFRCHDCDFVTYRKENLKSHINSAHLKEKKFSCDKCGYFSYIQANLISHVKGVHEGIRRRKKRE